MSGRKLSHGILLHLVIVSALLLWAQTECRTVSRRDEVPLRDEEGGKYLLNQLMREARMKLQQVRAAVEEETGVEVWNRLSVDNFPSFIYNLCSMYYVVPDCLGEMFGDEFDISSIAETVCLGS